MFSNEHEIVGLGAPQGVLFAFYGLTVISFSQQIKFLIF